jgi:iron complex transport system substrate-binding protein
MTTQIPIKTIALIRSLTIAVLTVTTVTACQDLVNRSSVGSTSNSSSSNECRNFEHEMGTTKVCGQPQRIVVLGPYYLDPLLSLGVQPVAYGDHAVLHQGDYYDRPSQQIPYVGDRITQPIANFGLSYSPSIEAMVKVKPDLIIGSSDMNAQQYKTFDQIAPTLLLTWDETETNLRTIARSVNRSQQAEQVWSENAIAQSLDASKAGRVYSAPAYLCFGFHGAIGTKLYLEKLEKQFLN